MGPGQSGDLPGSQAEQQGQGDEAPEPVVAGFVEEGAGLGGAESGAFLLGPGGVVDDVGDVADDDAATFAEAEHAADQAQGEAEGASRRSPSRRGG